LRSELDEPAVLLPDFADLAAQVAELMASYDAGHLTRSELATRLDDAKVTHTDGSVWTIGVSSGQWYSKYVGTENWSAALPPDGNTEPTLSPVTVSTPSWLAQTPRLAPPAAPDTLSGFGTPSAPWPSVNTRPSGELLPSNASDDGYLLDDDGVWESTWEAAARPSAAVPALENPEKNEEDDLGLPPEFFLGPDNRP
jgi:hypothetical protein